MATSNSTNGKTKTTDNERADNTSNTSNTSSTTKTTSGYDVYPLSVLDFEGLPSAVQTTVLRGLSSSPVHQEHVESFEYMTRGENEHVLRILFKPCTLSLSLPEDKAAVSALRKVSNAARKKTSGRQQQQQQVKAGSKTSNQRLK
jgi:hypothetical protein